MSAAVANPASEPRASGGCVVWVTGLPASGKSTFARAAARLLSSKGAPACVLDGDELRAALVPPPGYGDEARDAFYSTLGRLAALLAKQGVVVLVAATAHRAEYRQEARRLAPAFLEVHVSSDPDTCAARDPKGLYAAARKGELRGLPGFDVVYEEPRNPAVVARGGRDPSALERLAEMLFGQAPSTLCAEQTGVRPGSVARLALAARGFRALAELLRSPPDARALAEAAAILGSRAATDPRLAPLRAALAGADVAALRSDWEGLLQTELACRAPNAPARAWAYVAADLEPDSSRATELLVLAALAERAAWADRVGSSGIAVAILERRAAFLHEHARVCLFGLAQRLAAARTEVLVRAGAALSALLESESL